MWWEDQAWVAVLLSFLLVRVFWEDWKTRTILILWPMALVLASMVWLSISGKLFTVWVEILLNELLILMLWGGLWLYTRLFKSAYALSDLIGSGDFLLMLALGTFIRTEHFLSILLMGGSAGLLHSLVFRKDPSIPFAGMLSMACCLYLGLFWVKTWLQW